MKTFILHFAITTVILLGVVTVIDPRGMLVVLYALIWLLLPGKLF
jgi:hypothetical protein